LGKSFRAKPEIGTCIVPICVSVKLVWLSY